MINDFAPPDLPFWLRAGLLLFLTLVAAGCFGLFLWWVEACLEEVKPWIAKARTRALRQRQDQIERERIVYHAVWGGKR